MLDLLIVMYEELLKQNKKVKCVDNLLNGCGNIKMNL